MAPPGPHGRANARYLRRLFSDPAPALDALHAQFGPICSLGYPGVRLAIIGDPALMHEIFAMKADAFRWNHKFNVVGVRFVVGKQSMIVSDGADHQRRRGLFQRAQAFIEAPGIKQLPHPFPYTARSRVRADRRVIDRIIDEEVADRRAQPIGGPLDIGAPAMALSWWNGVVVNTDTIAPIADGVAGRHAIPEVLEDLLEVVDDVVLVDDESINAGMRHLFDFAGLVEPSAALGVAAVLEDRERFRGRNVATIICGSNIMTSDFQRWVLDHRN